MHKNISDQSGCLVIVTGANSGIGYETVRALAQKGATVIMACRNLDKGNAAAEQIRQSNPVGNVAVMQLDLGDLDSVSQFASEFQAKYDRLDLLINNAGIMVPPYGKTAKGFESQFGVNHLGHFALTGQLLDLALQTSGSRVVTVSSMAHRFGKIDFDDLQWQSRSYNANRAYGQSKLANLLFTYELQRKLDAAGKETIATAAHPGWTATNLQQHSSMARYGNRFFAQDSSMGALPTLYAATSPDAHGGGYYGPNGLGTIRGYPAPNEPAAASTDSEAAQRLWELSEQLVSVTAPSLAGIEAPPTLHVGSLMPVALGNPDAAGPILAETMKPSMLGGEGMDRGDPLMRGDRRYRAYRAGSWKLVETSEGEAYLFDLAIWQPRDHRGTFPVDERASGT